VQGIRNSILAGYIYISLSKRMEEGEARKAEQEIWLQIRIFCLVWVDQGKVYCTLHHSRFATEISVIMKHAFLGVWW